MLICLALHQTCIAKQDDTLVALQVTALVALMKAHMRKWLPDILQLIADFWSPTSPLLHHLLKLLSELAGATHCCTISHWCNALTTVGLIFSIAGVQAMSSKLHLFLYAELLLYEFTSGSYKVSLKSCTYYNAQFLFAVALRDDIRAYLPGLLPKFVALFGEAERGGGYDLVRPALACLEALGTALEDHLALLLPALVRLIHPSERSSESCTPS